MEHFLDWFVPTLKFTAIFISGASGILSLLVDFKDKHNKITLWGRRAVIIVVVSFLVSAIMQGIELYQDHKKGVAEEQKTQNILSNINRQLYNIDQNDISFDVTSKLVITDRLFGNYYQRLQAYCSKLIRDPYAPLPKGVDTSFIYPDGKRKLNGLEIGPGSVLYPDSVREKAAYDLIGKIMLDIRLYKYDPEKKQLSPKSSLDFGTVFAHPRLWYTPGDTTITVSVDGLKVPATDFAWRNQGDIQSLLDLKNGRIIFGYSDAFINNLDPVGEEMSKRIRILSFSFDIASRRYSSGEFCTVPGSGFPQYYLDLPGDILSTHLNMRCK